MNDEPLSVEEVRKIAEAYGRVRITWSGGNGPHTYTLGLDESGAICAYTDFGTGVPFHEKLRVGIVRPGTLPAHDLVHRASTADSCTYCGETERCVCVPSTPCGYTTRPGRWCDLTQGHTGEHNEDGPLTVRIQELEIAVAWMRPVIEEAVKTARASDKLNKLFDQYKVVAADDRPLAVIDAICEIEAKEAALLKAVETYESWSAPVVADKLHDSIVRALTGGLCDGCNVRALHEHRCWEERTPGGACACEDCRRPTLTLQDIAAIHEEAEAEAAEPCDCDRQPDEEHKDRCIFWGQPIDYDIVCPCGVPQADHIGVYGEDPCPAMAPCRQCSDKGYYDGPMGAFACMNCKGIE